MIIALLVLARTLHLGSAMLLFALPFFNAVILQPGRKSGSRFQAAIIRWLWVAWLVEALSGLAWFWLVAAQMSDQSPWTLMDFSDLEAVLWQMQFGRLWLVRLAVGVVLGAVIFFYSRRPSRIGARPAVALWLILGLSFLLLISLAWAGHAVAGIHDRVLHLGVDALHLVTGAVWPVGLVPLSLFLREANRREEDLSGDGQHESLERFSQVSFVAVLVLVVTGTINGCLMIGSWRALFTTPYGELLLGKVAIAGIMIGLGAFNRLRLLPRMGETSGALRTLRGTVLAESVLAAAVLLIVGMMGMTSPPS